MQDDHCPSFYAKPIKRLCPRDIEWLQKLANGASGPQLHTSYGYTRTRLASVRQLLNARTTTQAVAEAIRRGIIE